MQAMADKFACQRAIPINRGGSENCLREQGEAKTAERWQFSSNIKVYLNISL